MTAKPGIEYEIVPAARAHFLTPYFDLGAELTGVGRRFKSAVVERAGLAHCKRVVELGCGSGLTCELIKQRFSDCEVVGVDPDRTILEMARRRLGKSGVGGAELICARAEATGLAPASVDVVLSILTFHHLPPQAKEAAAAEAARLLRPGGVLFVVDLKPLLPIARQLNERERASSAYGLRTNTPERLRNTFEAAGFEVSLETAPGGGLFSPWIFGLRGRKRTTGHTALSV
jgi:ubiquinone/menaquinone biosynthesis C-methylase UbiE